MSSLLLSMPEMKGPAGERGLPGYDGNPGPPGSTVSSHEINITNVTYKISIILFTHILKYFGR